MTARARTLDFKNARMPLGEVYARRLRSVNPTGRLWAAGGPFTVTADGTMQYAMPDVTTEMTTRAVRVLDECRADPKPRLHHYYNHPELEDIPYLVLKQIYKEQLEVHEAKKVRPADGAGTDDDRPKVWNAKDLKPARAKRWLAKSRIPYDAVSLLVGDEGIGKSLFWVWIVAAVTTGKPLPEFGIPARDPQHVRLVLTEDDWSTEVRPRLELEGADFDHISVICANDDGSGNPTFPDDIDLISEDPAPALVVVDGWLDTVPAKVNVQSPQGARQVLGPWKGVATQLGTAVMLIAHTNRMDNERARSRYGVTGELRKIARMALFAQLDDDGALMVGPEKANGSIIVSASRFVVEPVAVRRATDDDNGTVPRLKYVGDSTKTARQAAEEKKPEFADWLRDILAEGPLPSADVLDMAKRDGVSQYQLAKAKDYLLVESYKDSEFQGKWHMRLPRGLAK
ncbi:AAA family ATPase [Mycobacteroides immunogenum]|uniref:AAA family ATPase n=1 Tax=Mycobacteroides immunogenum TaxID=83262 RepID=UPI0025B76BBB|nr:AAA family ATPase [Mycobacteroides immunogenum]WJR33390.1 AAA family ATPase [Mycobacteroides immunogenum]